MGKRLTTDTHVEITFRHHTFLGFPSFSPSFWVFITLSPGLTKEPVLLALMISPAVLVRSSEPPVDTGKPREHRPESQHLWGAGTSTVKSNSWILRGVWPSSDGYSNCTEENNGSVGFGLKGCGVDGFPGACFEAIKVVSILTHTCGI